MEWYDWALLGGIVLATLIAAAMHGIKRYCADETLEI